MWHKPGMRLRLLMATVGLAGILGGCAADRTLGQTQSACANPSVLAEIDCTKRRLEREHWRDSEVAESVSTYLAYADAVAEKVRAGRLTDHDARQDLRTMLLRLRNDTQATHPYFLYWLWPA